MPSTTWAAQARGACVLAEPWVRPSAGLDVGSGEGQRGERIARTRRTAVFRRSPGAVVGEACVTIPRAAHGA
jgi:hypothetical protein